MATRHARAPAASPVADDFKLIHGIGPGVESRLHGQGITTFAQLAALTPAELMALLSDLAALSPERIVKQDWIGQARELLASSQAHAPAAPAAEHARQRYATFTIELLLDAEQGVRRTRLAHLQSEAEESWAGWDAARLIELIAEHAPLHLAAPAAPPIAGHEDAEPQGVAIPPRPIFMPAYPRSEQGVGHEDATTQSSIIPAPPFTPLRLRGEQPEAHPGEVVLVGAPRLQQIELRPADGRRPYQILRHAAPANACLVLDLRALQAPPGAALHYHAAIYARPIGGTRQPIGEGQGEITAGASADICVPGIQLAPGTYRVEALVALHPAGTPASDKRPSALLEGGLIQVY